MLVTLIAFSAPAEAWVCARNGIGGCCYIPHDAPTVEYRIDPTGMPAGWPAIIEAAAEAWNAGPGEINVDANLTMVRDADVSNASWGNGVSEIYMANLGTSSFADMEVKHTLSAQNCQYDEIDIRFNSNAAFVWHTGLPSDGEQIAIGTSIGQSAVSAFGEMLGFDLAIDNGALYGHSVLAASPYHGGDLGKNVAWRIHEYDYVGVVDVYPCVGATCSDGTNLMLSKFADIGSGSVEEVWTDGYEDFFGHVWEGQANDTITGADRPSTIYVSITGTDNLADVRLRWMLHPTSACTGGLNSKKIDDRLVTIGVGKANGYNLGTWTVPNLPPGDYYVGAVIDPANDIAETSEGADNQVCSDKVFTILP